MKRIFTFFIVPFLSSCNTNDCCTIIDINVSIKFLSTDGKNLFDLDGFTESNIDIYHKIEGDWEKYYQGNQDNPKGIRVDELEDGYYLTIFPSTTTNSTSISETKIEFSESDFDILKTEIDKSNSNMIVTKVWYNDVLQNKRTFEVIK